MDWEVLVVDNASNDGTGERALELVGRLPGCRGRVIREETLGLSFARRRAAVEAKGEIICFLDDDNIPDENFVANAINAFRNYPQAGSLGGKVIPQWETEPTPLALAVADYALAICNRGEEAFRYEGLTTGPVGAGLCIRSHLLRQLYAEKTFAGAVVGRTGHNFACSEDTAITVRLKQLGWECWYIPALQLQHQLPASRMSKKYLLRLYEGVGQGHAAVRRLYDSKANNPLLAAGIAAKDLGRWLSKGCSRLGGSLLSGRDGEVSKDLNDLERRMLLGRASETLAIWR